MCKSSAGDAHYRAITPGKRRSKSCRLWRVGLWKSHGGRGGLLSSRFRPGHGKRQPCAHWNTVEHFQISSSKHEDAAPQLKGLLRGVSCSNTRPSFHAKARTQIRQTIPTSSRTPTRFLSSTQGRTTSPDLVVFSHQFPIECGWSKLQYPVSNSLSISCARPVHQDRHSQGGNRLDGRLCVDIEIRTSSRRT